MDSMPALRSYGAIEAGSAPRRSRATRHVAVSVAAVAIMALAAIVAAIAWTGGAVTTSSLLESQSSMDEQYMNAEANGGDGKAFLERLQRMWFVMRHKGQMDMSKEASQLATQLQIATFPGHIKRNINTEVNPCQDFYEFACGKWDKDNLKSIPEYSTSWSLSWDAAEEKVVKNMISVLKQDDGPAGTYFKACNDLDAINKAGAKPLEPWFELIDKIHDKQSLLETVVELNKGGLDHFFSWYIDTDSKDNEIHAFFLAEGGTSLPDKSYYADQTPEMVKHRAQFLERVEHFFALVGRKDAKKEAAMVMEFETALSAMTQDRTEAYKSHAEPATWAEMKEMVPSWDWSQWLTRLSQCSEPFAGMPQLCKEDHVSVAKVGTPEGKKLYIRNRGYFEKLDKFLGEQSLEGIKAEMRWNIIKDSASSLSTEFQDSLLVWYKDLYGVQHKSPRPRKCYYSATSSVGWASAHLYSDKLFNHANIGAAKKMLEEIRTEFHKSIPHADWMSEESRKAAQNKLTKMFFEVGVPTDRDGNLKWPHRANALVGMLGSDGGDYFKNGMISTRVSIERSFEKLDERVQRDSWGSSTPLEVNAFYGPKANGLWIPAGILQAPFFDAGHQDAQNYGSVGTILGHEMSHAFDDDGSQYDAEGQLRDWWDAKTVAGFKERSGCISKVFDKYKVLDKSVNGKLTLGEDIADAGGLKFSYRALTAKPRTDEEKRLFFTSFAQTWCEVDRKKSAVTSVLTDEHAPGKFRVIGALTQFKPFQDAFQCPDGSPMAPKDSTRCHLW